MDYVPETPRPAGILQTVLQGTLHRLFGAWALLVFVLLALLALLAITITPGEDRRRRLVRVAACAVLALWGTRLRVEGLDRLPASACVVVANHASYLDGMILTAALPPRFAFVIKKEITRVPLAHFLLRRVGSEFVDRFDSQKGAMDVRRILQRALTHESLAFFPEGTFRPEPGLRRFQGGAFAAAWRAGAPLVPVVISGSRSMLPARRWLPRPGRLAVSIRPPILNPDRQHSAAELQQAARASILAGLDEPDLLG
jgi:1-acyl-sn-glycerol-3-phosphate acyltransferase